MISLTRKVLCLDWDRRSLRILAARVSAGSVQLEDAHAYRLPGGLDVDDAAPMGAFIARALREKGIRHRRAIVDVPRDKAVINRLSLPPTPAAELASVVRLQALKELPFPLDEAVIDFVPLARDREGRATEVLLAAVRVETLERVRAVCTGAGLELARVGLRPYANLVTARHMSELADRRVLFVDVGPTLTEINVFRAGVFTFSRSAGVSVWTPGGDVAGEDSRVSSKADLVEVALSEEMQSESVEELLVEITRTLQAYRATEPEAAIDQIVIAGGTGIEPALALGVERRLQLAASVFDPSTALRVRAEDRTKLRAFSALIGLACGASREGQLELDFLHPKRPVPRHESLQKRLRMGGIAAAGVLALSGVWVLREFLHLNAEIGQLDKLVNRKDGQLTQEVRELVTLDIRAAEVDDWQGDARQLVWLDHLLRLTRSAVDPGKQMKVTQMGFSGSRGLVTLKLVAASNDVAQTFVEQINQVRVQDRPLYAARLGTWYDAPSPDGKFKGNIDVQVELLGLQTLRDPKHLKELEKQRKTMVDEV